jgi:hypothetical protein
VHLFKFHLIDDDCNHIKPVTLSIISIYAHGIACRGSLCACNEYGDPLSSAGVRGSDHSMLGKTVLCKLLMGRISLHEWRCLWTLLPYPITYNAYILGCETFTQCLGNWCSQLPWKLSEEPPTLIYVYSKFQCSANILLSIYI